jgi:chemotaxis protein MotA
MMYRNSAWLSVMGVVAGLGIVAWAHVAAGGSLRMFLQAEALVVVFGGTFAALLVSFSSGALRAAAAAVIDLARRRPEPIEGLVPAFMGYARKARQRGLMVIEDDASRAGDAFLARALTLLASGMSVEVVREALDLEARVCAEREEERAQVFEAAAGYSPTLGIVGAVLGLMRVMEHFSASAVGPGIAAAFVATLYGVGLANLLFLPLATRLRARARLDALRRELVIDGVLALHDGASPGVVEERLAGYLRKRGGAFAEAA